MSIPATARRCAFATSADHPSIQPDDAYLATSLQRLGVDPVVCVWNDPRVDWSAFDAVLIRTIWDYFKHHAAFLDWLDRLDRLGVPTINDSALLRWNSDKRYLLELAQHGVAIIPTRLASAAALPDVLAAPPPVDGIRVVHGAALQLPGAQANVRIYLVQSDPASPDRTP